MPAHRGISIGVLCGQVLLDEYEEQHTDERTVSCFVASEPGKAFKIILTSNLDVQDVSVSIHVDGGYIGRYFLAHGQKVLPGIYVSETLTKPFRFRELSIKDQRQLHDPRHYSLENVGTLDFNVYRCQKTGVKRFRPQTLGFTSGTTDIISRNSPTPSPTETAAGSEISMKPIQSVGGVTIDPPELPYARIFFRYRPRDILMLQGVIQPSMSPMLQPSLSRASSSTLVATGPISASGRKRSLDIVAQSVDVRPAQRLRLTPSLSTDEREPTTPKLNSHNETPSWSTSLIMEGNPPASAELRMMKGQLRAAIEQTDITMRQMRNSLEHMTRCMSQMQFLQQRIEAIEARTQAAPGSGMAYNPGYRSDLRQSAESGALSPLAGVPWMQPQFAPQQHEPRPASWAP